MRGCRQCCRRLLGLLVRDEVAVDKVEVRQREVQKLTLMHSMTSADWRGHDEQAGEHARE